MWPLLSLSMLFSDHALLIHVYCYTTCTCICNYSRFYSLFVLFVGCSGLLFYSRVCVVYCLLLVCVIYSGLLFYSFLINPCLLFYSEPALFIQDYCFTPNLHCLFRLVLCYLGSHTLSYTGTFCLFLCFQCFKKINLWLKKNRCIIRLPV